MPSPVSTIAQLTPSQKDTLEKLCTKYPTIQKEEIFSFLRFRDFDYSKSVLQIDSFVEWSRKLESKCPTILDVAPFMRTPDDAEGPDGCIVLLEDMKGTF